MLQASDVAAVVRVAVFINHFRRRFGFGLGLGIVFVLVCAVGGIQEGGEIRGATFKACDTDAYMTPQTASLRGTSNF